MNAVVGLIPVADVPCLLNRDRDRVDMWIGQGVLPTVTVDGATYVRRADVEPLRDPVKAMAAVLDAALADGRSILPTSAALAVLISTVGDALDVRHA